MNATRAKRAWLTFAGCAGLLLTAAPTALAQAGAPFEDGAKVALQADNGLWMSRCNGCQKTVNNRWSDTVLLTGEVNVFSTFTVRAYPDGKIGLVADNGRLVSYCNGCIPGASTPDFLVIQNPGDADNVFNRFEVVRLANDRFALKSSNGKYASRCRGCSPGASLPDQATSHVTDPNGAPWIVKVVAASSKAVAPASAPPPVPVTSNPAGSANFPPVPSAAECRAFGSTFHMITFDSSRFDVLTAGPITLVESDGVAIQIIAAPSRINTKLFAIVGLAVRAAGTVVRVDSQGARFIAPGAAIQIVPGGAGSSTLRVADGTEVSMTGDGAGGSTVSVKVPAAVRGRIVGLCGNFDGNATNDLVGPDGKASTLNVPTTVLANGTQLGQAWIPATNKNLFACGASCSGFAR